MCHMVADTIDELHAMANAIGMRREWFQTSRSGIPHYDVPLFRRHKAIEFGAISVSNREMAKIIIRMKSE
jgi:hypothetical protein